MPLNHHPTFDHYPRILARYGDDPQVFELFRCEKGWSLSAHEIRGYVAHLSPQWHWWVAYTTKPQALIGTRPRMNMLGTTGSYIHRPPLALTTREVYRLIDDGVIPPKATYAGFPTVKAAIEAESTTATQPTEQQAIA